tara:strand:- start:4866 stop:5357 length:492 start_codon:yes stop_codon:yes gene_type:complete
MDDIDRIKAQWAVQRPDLNTDPMALIGRLGRLRAHVADEMGKTFAKHGLTSASFDVLATLLRAGPPHALTPNQLLDTMMITSGTMTNRIDQLVRAGLVRRVPNPDDKRSVSVALTDVGRALIDRAVTEHVATQERIVSVLSPDEQTQLNALLKAFLAKAQAAR